MDQRVEHRPLLARLLERVADDDEAAGQNLHVVRVAPELRHAAFHVGIEALANGKKKDATQQANRAKQLLARNTVAYGRAEEIHREAKQGDD